jgi:hypothetical protein
MGRSGIGQLLYLLDEAFEGNEEHSLLGNLRTVTPDDWLWLPPFSSFVVPTHSDS